MALGDKVVVVVDEGKGPVKHEERVDVGGGSISWEPGADGFVTVEVRTKGGGTIRRSAYATSRVVSITTEPARRR